MPDILHRLDIEARPDAVDRALSTSEGVRGWWTRDAEVDTRVGGRAVFRFPAYGPGRQTRVEITCHEPARRLSWNVLDSLHPEWLGTTIDFTLQAGASGTSLGFAHRGFTEADTMFALFTTGWAYYLVSLKSLLERGTGLPHPDIDFVRNFAMSSPPPAP